MPSSSKEKQLLVDKAISWFGDDRLRRTRRRLLHWGRKNFREFAWRSESDPWLTLVAEFLLQRTRATQVEPVFCFIRQKYPTPRDMISSGAHAANDLTSQLGLHRRGRYLLDLAAEIERCKGKPPDNFNQLTDFPGVGMYTAAAWLSLHRGIRAVIIDANVTRWLSRMTGLPYNRDPRGVHWVYQVADLLTPSKVFRDYNYAILDFTMMICVPKRPRCELCPLQNDCWFVIGS